MLESEYEQTLRIDYGDIGENNSLTLKGLIRMLQEIACVHSDKVGYGVNDAEKTHLAWLILNWKIEMYEKPRWNTKIKIKTWARSFDKLQSCRDFEVHDMEDNLIAKASSKWILINTETHKLSRITQEIIDAYSCSEKCVFEEDSFDNKLDLKDLAEKPVYTYTIQKRDIDTNHHVNNLYYLDYAYEALPEEVFENMNFKSLEILYKKELKYKDTISCFYKNVDNKHIIVIKDLEQTKTHAVISFN